MFIKNSIILKRNNYLSNIFLALGVMFIVIIVFYYNSREINLKVAYQGFGPHNYVAQKMHPENFINDWPNGIETYDYSVPMRVFYYLAKYFEISPSFTVYPFMFFQTLVYLLSVAFLAQTLFRNKYVTFLSVVVLSTSNLAGLNLARFGNGYSSALGGCLYYSCARSFSFFSLGLFLRNRYILCSVSLALSIFSHVNIGLFTFVFIGAYFLIRPKSLLDRPIVAGIIVFLMMIVPYIYVLFLHTSISSGGIPLDQWVKATKIFGYHWYPMTRKMFTENAHMFWLPFLLLCFFFFASLKYQDIRNEKHVKIIVGCIACLVMSIFGVIVSSCYPIPVLIKVALHRSSGLITFFGVLYVVYYTYQKMNAGHIASVFFAILSLLIFIFYKPGIAVLPLFLLIFSDIRKGYIGPIRADTEKTKYIIKTFYYTLAAIIILLTFTNIFQDKFGIVNNIFVNLWDPLKQFNPLRSYDFLLQGGEAKIDSGFSLLILYSISCSLLYMTVKLIKIEELKALFMGILIFVCVSAIWYIERDQYMKWHNEYSSIAQSYLDLQLWAKEYTPKDSLFMPDPSHHYGWRDFSERSSFGNLREWGYLSIAYDPDYNTYIEGRKRMKEFGIIIDTITNNEIKEVKTNIYGNILNREVRKNYYTMSPENLKSLFMEYRIDYAVMKNNRLRKKQKEALLKQFKIVYENDQYTVYAAENQAIE